ncbi:SMI1/KNR4 family protein [Macrococcoides canis]|uniref:SMI1/KNR4 family protein n=1 Tax=Macrococcoides canis TaxID=1855823 RepID=UPI0020B7571A|nr:SMI1/KNR4 family protein [Macrococcus canis]UTH10678.1 SMI1/KNR4 family protein [Macrococcus canis]
MDYENLKNKLEVRGNKLTESDIDLFESWRGYKLPDDFVEFTLKYPGAYLEGSFDAEDRPGSMISNFLRFSKEGYSSIYVEDAYEITNFGPYVLFGEDPGGNYIAFDYSKDDLNPSVVFIDHEELGIIELPEGTSENDFTEEELDKMMSSEKLEDFPWAIHYVSDSFSDFINKIKIQQKNKVRPSEYTFDEHEFKNIIEDEMINKSPKLIQFLKKYGGCRLSNVKDININGYIFDLNVVINFNKHDIWGYTNLIIKNVGYSKYVDVFPFMVVKMSNEVYGFSALALKSVKNKIYVYLIPNSEFEKKDKLLEDKIIYLTDNLEKFIDKIENIIES